MIQIIKTKKGKFQVVNVAKNGELLKSSELLESRQACLKNIKSEIRECYTVGDGHLNFQDNTGERPVIYGWWWNGGKPFKPMHPKKTQTPYFPGKNKSVKTPIVKTKKKS